ncbi:MAG: tryptophan--tRNA ligase [Gammaproteobacteria bacterium]|nr:tryptophan--tRNA ligase [Gammaproteobacteria bacterium]
MLHHKKVLLSGIQPSGKLNIGNYIGAIKNWVNLQDEYESFFFLADMHTITVKQHPDHFREQLYDVLALYLACGLDPDKNTIFCQSHVTEHAELAWILNCFAYMGELNRMTQFKDKSQRAGKNINVGLFAYPILQAADILLYSSDVVPVGADQKQHLELARDIALRFNNIYGDVFKIPEPFIPKAEGGARIMALQDPTKKMSKSDENENNTICLLDDPKQIIKKVKRAVTDSETEVKYAEYKPGVSNLLTIYSAVTGKAIKDLEQEYIGAGYGKFKQELADAVVAFITPIQEEFYKLRNDKNYLHEVLGKNAEKARVKARPMLEKVYNLIGFIR